MLIGELAKRANASKDAIRLYERRGFIRSNPIVAGSRTYNDYSEATLQIVKDIRQARLLGISLKDWEAFYNEWVKPDSSDAKRHALLATELKKIRQKISELKKFEDLVVKKMQRYQTDTRGSANDSNSLRMQ